MAWCCSPLISLVFRWALGGIFLYAGLIKTCDSHGFAFAIYNYQILPGWMINPMAILMPGVETMVGVSLLLGIRAQAGALVATGLLGVFALALGMSLIRGLDIACGCFGTACSAGSITWLYLLRDLILMVMSVHIFSLDREIASMDRLIQKKLYDETQKKDHGE
jgi:uncharacterized membrane protein YphA (DoxX/SURF4 family)